MELLSLWWGWYGRLEDPELCYVDLMKLLMHEICTEPHAMSQSVGTYSIFLSAVR